MATTAAQYRDRALREVGQLQINAIFQVYLPMSTTAGTLTGTFNAQTSANIAFNADAETFQTAMEALSTIGAGNIFVYGVPVGPYLLEFMGDLAGQEAPFPSFNGTNLTPPSPTLRAVLIQQGATQDFAADADLMWLEANSQPNSVLKYLRTKLGLINLQLGIYSQLVDNAVGYVNRVENKDSQRFDHLMRLKEDTLADLAREEEVVAAQNAGQTHFGKILKLTPNGEPFGFLKRDVYGRLV